MLLNKRSSNLNWVCATDSLKDFFNKTMGQKLCVH